MICPRDSGNTPASLKGLRNRWAPCGGSHCFTVSWLVRWCGSRRPRNTWRGTTGTLVTVGLTLATFAGSLTNDEAAISGFLPPGRIAAADRVGAPRQRFGLNQRSIGFLRRTR